MSSRSEDDRLLEIFHDCYDRMINHAYRMTSNRDESEDIVAHVFSVLATEVRRGRTPANPTAWLYRCVSNRVVSLRRRSFVRSAAKGELWNWMSRRHQSAEPDANLSKVRAALMRLKESDRQIIVLRYDEELEFAAIAEILGIAEASVRSRLSRALARLRRKVEEMP